MVNISDLEPLKRITVRIFNVSKYFIEENNKVTNKISKTVVRRIKSSKTISAHMTDI
jgi:hypothetical protein